MVDLFGLESFEASYKQNVVVHVVLHVFSLNVGTSSAQVHHHIPLVLVLEPGPSGLHLEHRIHPRI